MTPSHPVKLGKYRVDGVIGQGAMGVVYKGFDEDIARPVALKVMHAHLVDADGAGEMASRFKREAQAAARCLHGNIVAVFDYGASADSQYIVMEYVEGTDLRTFLKRAKKLPCLQAIDIVAQVLAALDYAHGNGVVHRDIKPANIMLLANGRVKVADFGIAKLDTSELTSTGVVIGTPSYMSPEARRGQAVDAKSDIYAAGVVFYQMISGVRPLPTLDILSAVTADLRAAIPDSAAAAVFRLLLRVLEPDQAKRLASAREFLDALNAIDVPRHDGDPATGMFGATMLCGDLHGQSDSAATPATDPSRPSRFPATVTDKLLAELIPFVGPLASRLIKRTAPACATLRELVDALADQIPNETERKRFRDALKGSRLATLETACGHLPEDATRPSPRKPAGGGFELSEDRTAQIVRLLTEYVGPLASRIIRRAAAGSSTSADFSAELAGQIPNDKERAGFLERLRPLLDA
jgi:serine/threonine-protein kinase